jgi:hypothetical protein
LEEASLRNVVAARLNGVRTRLLVAPRYQRAFHAFGIGMEKTGTHSIAAVLNARFRSDHEPDYPTLIRHLMRRDAHTDTSYRHFLRKRDAQLWLEMESCWLHVFHVRELVDLFPESRFILTVRDCYAWLDSLANHMLAGDVGPHWRRAQRAYYRPDAFEYDAGEAAFERAGLFPIRAYLSAWARHNHLIVDAVPPDRLLVVRTSEIEDASDQIASFLGVPFDAVDGARGHQYANAHKFHMLEQVDPHLLEDTVQTLCGDLMARWFSPTVERAERTQPS